MAREKRDPGRAAEDRYLLRDLAELAAEDGVVAVSRLIVVPSFHPETIITVFFGSIELAVETVGAATPSNGPPSAPANEPQDQEGALEPAFRQKEAVSRRGSVQSAFAPHPFDSVAGFAKATAAAPSIPFARSGPDGKTYVVADGVGYVHRFVAVGRRLDAEWPNPSYATDPAQCKLIAAYRKLVGYAGIKDESLAL